MATLPLDPAGPHGETAGAAIDTARNGFAVAPWRVLDIHALSDGWDQLADRASDPNPFYERWFCTRAVEALSDDVHLATLHDGDTLVGLLPLARDTGYYGYPLPHWRGWLHENAFCGAPLVAKGHEQAFWTALLNWADQNARTALFLHFEHLPVDGASMAALDEVLRSQNRHGAIVHRRERALLVGDATPEEYFAAAMSTKKRKELRRQARRLGEEGELTFTRQDGRENVGDWAKAFLELEKAGWKGQEGTALACDPATEQLFLRSLQGAADAGRLELLDLSLDGKPIAMLANFITPPGSFAFKTTFDEDYARFSPGVLLQKENLDLLAREGLAWCDSCAAADHPMIERIWRDKREVVRVSIAIGGKARRALYAPILRKEAGRVGPGLLP